MLSTLHDDADMLPTYKRLSILNDVWMVEVLHELYFSEDLLFRLFTPVLKRDLLNVMGEYFHDVGVIVDGGENEMGFSKVAAAHFLDELIGVV